MAKLQELGETDANYDIVWTTLENDFDNEILIASKHLRNLFELQKVN